LEEDITNCRKSYETEISLLKTQNQIYAEDFSAVKRELEAALTELSTVKLELLVARNMVGLLCFLCLLYMLGRFSIFGLILVIAGFHCPSQ